MRGHAALLCVVVALVCCSTAVAERDSARGKDGKDDHVGAIWNYTIARGKEKHSGTFRVHEGKIYKRDKQVGTYEVIDKGKKTTITFTDWEEMNGTVTLTKPKENVRKASGTLKKADGTKWDMSVDWKDG